MIEIETPKVDAPGSVVPASSEATDLEKVKESELPDSDFAFIATVDGKKERKLRIDDEAHARNALARMNQVKPPLTEAEMDTVARKIKRRYPFISVDRLKKSRLHSVCLEKSMFPDPPAMEKWLVDNGFRRDQKIETAVDVIYIQNEALPRISAPEFEFRELARGVSVNFEKSDGFEIFVQFRKESMNEEERTVEGLVYAPSIEDSDDQDSQGDWATEEDIREAAHYFMEQGQTGNVDNEHNFQKNGCTVVESFLAKACDPYYRKGSWVVKVKVNSDQMWAKVKTGEINGFSMAGSGVRVYQDEPRAQMAAGGFSFSKGVFQIESVEKACGSKKRTRLTKIRPSWISLVKAGANLTDFTFIKSAEGAETIFWKSRDQQILDGDIQFMNERTLIDTITGLFKKYLGGSSPVVGAIPNVPAADRVAGQGKVDMKKIDPTAAGLFSLLTQIGGRLAQTEKILKTLLANEGFAPFVKANPGIAEILTKTNPEDLVAFSKLADFLAQGSEPNGVTLPSVPANLYGFASATIDPMAYVSRAEGTGPVFPEGVMMTGTPASGNDQGLMKQKLDELEKQFAAFQEQVKSRPTFDPTVLTGFGKSIDELKAKIETVAKAQTAVPMLVPVVKTEAPAAPKPPATESFDPISKAKDLENPYGTDPVAIFGGIANSGKDDWLKK